MKRCSFIRICAAGSPTRWSFGLLAAALGLLSSCALAGESVKYVYTIEVETYGPVGKADQAATVEVSWRGGSKTLTLPGRRGCDTVEITQKFPRLPEGAVLDVRMAPFVIEVSVAKPGYDTWKAAYIGGDFVKTKDGVLRRIDKVMLQETDTTLTDEQRRQLSLALPCGLNIYAEQSFGDFNGDGNPDAALHMKMVNHGAKYPGIQATPYEGGLAEVRHMSLVGGQWKCVFLANHQGVCIDGKQVPGTRPAPDGYGFHGIGLYPEDGWIYDDLYPLSDKAVWPREAPARMYLWRKGAESFDVVTFDPADVPSLIGLLKDPNVSIRMRAARTLGQTKDKRALQPLVAALADDNSYSRSDAVRALERITGKDFGDDRPAWEAWLKESHPDRP
jgi:hypothetical protein